jgi:hypothetical protein
MRWETAGSDWLHLVAFLTPIGIVVLMGVSLVYKRLIKKEPPPPSFSEAFQQGLRGNVPSTRPALERSLGRRIGRALGGISPDGWALIKVGFLFILTLVLMVSAMGILGGFPVAAIFVLWYKFFYSARKTLASNKE